MMNKQIIVIAMILVAAMTVTASEPEEMAVTPPQYAPNPSLRANMVFRVLFAIISSVLCWVPLRLLWRNGDFAAATLVAQVLVLNAFTVFNSIAWNSDNWDEWWDGQGVCDVQVYLVTPLHTIYAACIFTIVWQLSKQVQVSRATQLNRQERRKRVLVHAAIIFPLPAFQLLFTWFDLAQRYNIGTLIGCMAVFDNSWPRFVVYDAPNPIFVLASAPYGCR